MRTHSNLLKPTQTLKYFSPGVSCEAAWRSRASLSRVVSHFSPAQHVESVRSMVHKNGNHFCTAFCAFALRFPLFSRVSGQEFHHRAIGPPVPHTAHRPRSVKGIQGNWD